MTAGKTKLWMLLVLVSLIGAAFFGRFFCGFICPINTIITPIEWIKKKIGFKEVKMPKSLNNDFTKYLVFIIFLGGFAYNMYLMRMGQKLPIFLVIIGSGIITTLFINTQTWHRYLCPWGTLFSCPARLSKRGMVAHSCTGCGICSKNCSGLALRLSNNKELEVDHKNCLMCFECTSKCPTRKIKILEARKMIAK